MHIEDEVKYYYDSHPTEEDLMGETAVHAALVPDGAFLRLYDKSGQMRLTGVEAEAKRANAEMKRVQALADKLRSLGVDPDQLL